MLLDFMSVEVLSCALLPPLNLLLLALLGLLLLSFRRKTGLALAVAAVAGLLLLSVPAVATLLAGLLENRYTKESLNLEGAQAIVILGGGSYAAAPEYGTDTVGAATLESARYARQHLVAAKVNRIVLVTHAGHMRRARLVFEDAGFSVIGAPTAFSTLPPPGILNFLPSARGLELSHAFFYEVIGLGW